MSRNKGGVFPKGGVFAWDRTDIDLYILSGEGQYILVYFGTVGFVLGRAAAEKIAPAALDNDVWRSQT